MKKDFSISKAFKNFAQSQLIIPVVALLILVIFNLIRDPSFFSIAIKTNSFGYKVLSGNLVSVLDNASELVILAIGMTLVTAATKGQDISVAAVAAIAGSIFVKVLKGNTVTVPLIILALLAACCVAMIFSCFNGILIAKFNIQPMIASLILFTAGRPIAYWINGGASPIIESDLISYFGGFIPGNPVPTPIYIAILFIILITVLLRFTTLSLFVQAVGINEKAAKQNGINPVAIKFIVFIILGACVGLAGSMRFCRIGVINHSSILIDYEMDAILAVAIGGNSLGGGKFKLSGSILGAYIIQALTTTLLAMKVPSTDIKAYKAIVILVIVIAGSPVVKAYITKFVKFISSKINSSAKVSKVEAN